MFLFISITSSIDLQPLTHAVTEAADVLAKPAPGHQKGMLGVLNFALVAAHNRSTLEMSLYIFPTWASSQILIFGQ
jgi:hypothetical protein